MRAAAEGCLLPESTAELLVTLEREQMELDSVRDRPDRELELLWRKGWNAAMKRALQCVEAALEVLP